ncbi:DUF4256 domain-containing protein [Ruminococcaceae bacterium OttesenSCG-928-I18]|nr:DUF4256 domain-containing protein [Ruminococcaceae bacterium OttesenSCG-928-I18]
MNHQSLPVQQREELLKSLETRFKNNGSRHEGVEWAEVRAKLEANAEKLWSLYQMEATGGEPDVVEFGEPTRGILFMDCCPESPPGRRNLCYDDMALEARKKAKSQASAMGVAFAMGIQLLEEEQYRALQTLGEFDLKTSSWVKTPAAVRALGGALFCDRRYGRVFLYHNGAESYYGARGFRGVLRV